MTTKIISTYIAAGYTLSSSFSALYVTASGGVGGTGVTAHGGVDVRNYGKINGGYSGIDLLGTGSVGNYAGATISGRVAVTGGGVGDLVFNYGVIKTTGYKAINFSKGGEVDNGGPFNHTASISGDIYLLGVGTVSNYATIKNGRISISGGGTVTNGAQSFSGASMYGEGVDFSGGAGTVENYGMINGGGREGVTLAGGGVVINGAATDTTARIQGGEGVGIAGAIGVVTNFGTVRGVGAYLYGVALGDGGSLTNGSVLDQAALVEGYGGVSISFAAGTVDNLGVILADSVSRDGVYLRAGGLVTNGGGDDHAALIAGGGGAVLEVSGTVHNFGTIRGATGYGVHMIGGGVLTNGSPTNGAALIEGYDGLGVAAAGSVTNLGTILGTGDGGGAAVSLGVGVSVVNGDVNHTGALIEGFYGLTTSGGADTVTNFGTIAGGDGVAVSMHAAGDTLVAMAGCVFVGAIYGDGGTLDLGSGVGTLSGLLAGGNVTVSGSMATTKFLDFGKVKVASGASFTAAGNPTIAAGQGLIVAGTLTTAGTLTIAGALTTTGTLAGPGALALTGGTSSFNTGAALTIAQVTQSGAASVANSGSASLTYARPWVQTAGTVSASAGDKFGFTGTGDSFAGTLAGAGAIAFAGGSDALTGTTLKAASVLVGAATVTLSGTISNASVVTVTSPGLIIAAAGASLTGSGSVNLSNLATNKIRGATASATLTNVNNRITGAGALGGGAMRLINQAGGIINGNQTVALIIDTGTNSIANAGLIENTSTGGTTIKSAIANTGTLMVTKGVLAVNAAVTGAGTVRIGGGTADFAGAFGENVAFTSTAGVLELARSVSYAGSVGGFSKTGTTSLDLLDIGFVSGTTKASYSGTTTAGTLTVTDGTHTAHIKLTGDYTASTFAVSSDGHGGTKVVDPTSAAATPPLARPFIDAMAAFRPTAAPLTVAAEPWHGAIAALAAPRVHPA